MCQQKIAALHCHKQILFFPHDGPEAQKKNTVDGQSCALCPAGDPSVARLPIFHRELLNPGHESSPSSGQLSSMESGGRSAELSQSAAPLFCSWLQVASLGFGLTVGLEVAQVWVGLTFMVKVCPQRGATTVQTANGRKKCCM